MSNLDVEGAAKYLRVSESTVVELALCGVLPGCKVGSKWIFPRYKLQQWLDKEVERQQKNRRDQSGIEAWLANNRSVSSIPNRSQRRKKQNPELPDLPELVSEG